MAELLDEPGGEAFFELRARHADGSWRWLEVAMRNLVDDPEIAGLVGLSSLLSTVAKSGGGITVESQPSAGTSVSVYLPALAD